MAKDNSQLAAEIEEQECIALAYRQARKQLEEGTAPPSIVTHFLQRGSAAEGLRKRKSEAEIDVMQAKTKNLNASSSETELLANVLDSIGAYQYDPNAS